MYLFLIFFFGHNVLPWSNKLNQSINLFVLVTPLTYTNLILNSFVLQIVGLLTVCIKTVTKPLVSALILQNRVLSLKIVHPFTDNASYIYRIWEYPKQLFSGSFIILSVLTSKCRFFPPWTQNHLYEEAKKEHFPFPGNRGYTLQLFMCLSFAFLRIDLKPCGFLWLNKEYIYKKQKKVSRDIYEFTRASFRFRKRARSWTKAKRS